MSYVIPWDAHTRRRSAVHSAVCSVESDQALTGKALGQGALGAAGSTRLESGVCALRSLAARPGTVAEEVSCKAWVRGQRSPSAWTFGPWAACRTQQYVVKSGFCLLEVALPFPTKEFICSADQSIGHCPESSCTAGPGIQTPRLSPVLGSGLTSLPR